MNPSKEQLAAIGRKLALSWARLRLKVTKRARRARGLELIRYRHAAAQKATQDTERLAGEVWETARAVVVQMEMPGMSRDDIQVGFSRGRLRIRGEKRRIAGDSQGRTYHLKERLFGRFERLIALPGEIDSARAEVTFLDGVITVIVPKSKATPPARPTP
jgi:HSP20 family protein